MSINEIIPSDAFILQVLGIGALIFVAVLAYGYRGELLGVGYTHRATIAPVAVLAAGLVGLGVAGWAWMVALWFAGAALVAAMRRPLGYVTLADTAIADDAFTPHQDAENENPEIPKSPALDQAAVDRMIAERVEAARWEALARAVGTLEGRGLLAPSSRSKALDALGIRGERYSRLKPLADAAQAAAQSEARAAPPPAAPPREIVVAAGRPEERRIPWGDDPEHPQREELPA